LKVWKTVEINVREYI